MNMFSVFGASGKLAAAVVLGLHTVTPSVLHGQELHLSTPSAEAQAEFRAGIHAIQNQLVVEGVRRMQRAVNADPKFALARGFYAAYASGLSDQNRDAQLQQAAADAMNATVAELSLVLAFRAATAAERRALLKAASDAAPGDRHTLFLYTSNLQGAADRARGFEQMTRRFPDFAPAYRELGYVHARELLQLPAALVQMQHYLRLQPDNPHAHHSMGEVFQRSARYPEAIEHYEHAIALVPRFVPGYTGLAEVALLERKPAAARAQYERAIANERSAGARFVLRGAQALLLLADGNARVAMRELTQIANEADTTGYPAIAAQLHRELAVLEAAYGNRSMVDSRIRKAATMSHPDNVQQQIFAAVAYALAGDVRGARPIVRALIAVAENTGSVTLERQVQAVVGVVQASGDDAEAASAAAHAAGPNGGLAKVLIAENLKRSGKIEEARTLAHDVLAITETDLLSIIARNRAATISN